MKRIRLHTLVLALPVLAIALLSGCGSGSPQPQQATPGPLVDDSYNQSVSGTGKWIVRYNYSCIIELDKDDVVHIYGIPTTRDGRSYFPDVFVSGKAHFEVHSCNTIKAADGASLTAHSSSLVKAMPGTTVIAHNCAVIRAAEGSKVEAHGNTKVEPVAMPQTPEPAPKPKKDGQMGDTNPNSGTPKGDPASSAPQKDSPSSSQDKAAPSAPGTDKPAK